MWRAALHAAPAWRRLAGAAASWTAVRACWNCCATAAAPPAVRPFLLRPVTQRHPHCRWHPSATDWNPFVLRLNDADLQAIKRALQAHEGCNMYGWLELQRVAGLVHISVRPEVRGCLVGWVTVI